MSQYELPEDPIQDSPCPPIITDADLLEARRRKDCMVKEEEAQQAQQEDAYALTAEGTDGSVLVPETPPHRMGVARPIRKQHKLRRKNRLAYHLRYCSGFDCTNRIYFNKKCPPYRTITLDIPQPCFRALFTNGNDAPPVMVSEVHPKGRHSMQVYFCSDYCWTQAKIQKPNPASSFRATVM